VVAVRGDDRPGMKKDAPAPAQGRGKWNDRKDAPRGGRDDKTGFGQRSDRPERSSTWTDTPRLGDTAFRAQRDALEHAELALRKLAAQAHGEALTKLLTAWEKRDSALVPSTQELGPRASASVRSTWVQALAPDAKAIPKAPAPHEALLRLEMAAEVPTPAEFLNDRRALQLQLLTRRNDAPPAQTWGQDTASVLVGSFSATDARRLQNVLKVLLKR
jgi:ATP-dependent RNA helicase SUPV3L1/SUV3